MQSQEAFFRMLARLMPTRDGQTMPWDEIPWRPRIHLGLFVNRVEGIPPGLYGLARDPDKLAATSAAARTSLATGLSGWRIPDCIDSLSTTAGAALYRTPLWEGAGWARCFTSRPKRRVFAGLGSLRESGRAS